MTRRSRARAGVRHAALALTVALLATRTASGVVTGTIVPVEGQQSVPTTVIAFPQDSLPLQPGSAFNRDFKQIPGGFPYLVNTTNGKVQLPDPPQEFGGKYRVSGTYMSWGPYEGFKGQAGGGSPYAGQYFRTDKPVEVGGNTSFNLNYTRPFKPCIKYGLTYDLGGTSFGCNANRMLTSQPLADGAAQSSATGPAGDMRTQWAFKKLGLPLNIARETLKPVVVAVIDSGLDYAHPYLKPDNIWRNPSPGAKPDFTGDLIGWNFVGNNNQPWDDYGHGTFVAGLITSINPAAQIMSVKVLDEFGAGPLSAMARGVIYAVDHGARIINISLGSRGISQLEDATVDYARAHGAVVVVAAGNEGVNTEGFGPAGARGVLGVAASDQNDKKPPFGNWGQQVALAAPGVDIISLRARWTDFVLVASRGKEYTPGANIVGADRWFFRASGTSFAAPFVAGAASLLLSRNPSLTNEQVERMLIESADDIETPGWDQFTGAGRLNIARALRADPTYYLTAKVAKVEATREGGQAVINVFGTATGSKFTHYDVQMGQGERPSQWKTVSSRKTDEVEDDLLATIPVKEITARGKWTIRLIVHDGSKDKEARGSLDVQ